MCTAATYQSAGFYFGRTLDYEVSYGNQIVITPRNYALRFRHTEDQPHHYAIIGMGLVAEDYPLYYDAMNEKGLCMAGLNFVGNAAYSEPGHDKENVAQFEFIPWLLGQCANLAEAKEKLQNLQLTDTLFNTAMPRAQLHWLIADRTGAVVVESMADGLHLYDNPVGVLTNNPPFPEQIPCRNLLMPFHLLSALVMASLTFSVRPVTESFTSFIPSPIFETVSPIFCVVSSPMTASLTIPTTLLSVVSFSQPM